MAITARRDTSCINHRTGEEGTSVLGLLVKPREIDLTGEQFNGNLKEEGIDEILVERTRTDTLGKGVNERYAKRVKAIFQVGAAQSDTWGTPLRYAAETVPLENPYFVKRGATLRVRCWLAGKPAVNMTVSAGGRTPGGARHQEIRVRTDGEGVATIPLAAAGKWYVKFVHARLASDGVDYLSQWATLAFESRQAAGVSPPPGPVNTFLEESS